MLCNTPLPAVAAKHVQNKETKETQRKNKEEWPGIRREADSQNKPPTGLLPAGSPKYSALVYIETMRNTGQR